MIQFNAEPRKKTHAWYYKTNQKPLGPEGKPITVTLLSGNDIRLVSKFLSLSL